MEKIDNLDRQILEIIMRNARIPSKDVAAKCGVSRAAIHQRIQRVPELEKIPEVVECHFTTGPYTMLCKLYARDNEHLMHLINDHVQQIAGVVSTETLISLDQSLNREIPIYQEVV